MTKKGYQIKDGKIRFIFKGHENAKKVFVSGNFNGWTKENNEWLMEFIKKENMWVLEKKIDKELGHLKNKNFLEFSFVVDGNRLDADQNASNIYHCVGYGYRYTIPDLFDKKSNQN